MSKKTSQKHDFETLINLLAPKELDIQLIPLEYVEKTEFLFYWCSIFLAITTSLFGSLVSLIAVGYINKPLIILLAVFMIIFLIIFSIFSIKWFKSKKDHRELFKSVKTPDKIELSDNSIMNNKFMSELRSLRLKELNEELKQTVKRQVFFDKSELPIELFKSRILDPIKDRARATEDRFLTICTVLKLNGLVDFNKDDSGGKTVKFLANSTPAENI